jgi:sugar lactone lactonase YvrE
MALLVGVTAHAQTASYTSTWTQKSPATSPAARFDPAMAYDDALGKLVMFGGDGSVYENDTWTYDGINWVQQTPATSPAGRRSPAMAYDVALAKLVMFGGLDGSGNVLNDTWTYDGTNWTLLSPAAKPSARMAAGLTYDAATGLVVLFGGSNSIGLADTWTFNGTTWTQQSPATSPPASTKPKLVYDSALGQVVLFSETAGTTWTYNGTTWTQQHPTTNPPAGTYAGIAYDIATGQIVMFGGTDASGNDLNTTWTYDGTNWTQESPAVPPPAIADTAMAYSPATGRVVMFGGVDDTGVYHALTYTYEPGPAVRLGNFNVCSGSAPAPCSTSETLIFKFATGGTIKVPAVLTQGASGLDFTDAGTGTCTTNGTSHNYLSGETCTVVVTFAPKVPGRRLGAVSLLNSAGSVIVSVLLSGTGTGPQGLFSTPSVNIFASGLGTPRGLSVDASGNVYVTESSGTTLDKFTPAGVKTTYTILTGSGGTAVDGAGNIFYGNSNSVYKIAAGTTTSVVYASGVGTVDNNLQVDTNGNLFLTNSVNNALYEIPAAAPHTPVVVFSSGTAVTGGGTTGRIVATAIDANNNLFFADFTNSFLYELLAGTKTPVALTTADGFLDNPHGIAVDPAGNVYVTNATSGSTGTDLLRYSFPFVSRSSAHFQALSSYSGQYGAVIGGDGTIYLISGTSINQYVRSAGPALAFGSLPAGSTSAVTLQEFENDGNAVLTISSITASTANFTATAAAFDSYAAACNSSLPSTGLCGFSFKFTPQTVGTLTGTGTVTDNSLNISGSTQTVALSGTGTQNPQTITFPQPATPVATGTIASLTASSTSALAVTFSITGGTGTATLSGTNNSTITYTSPGTVLITASQAGNTLYSAATPVTDTVTVTAPRSVYVAPTTAIGSTSPTQTAYVNITTAGTPATISVLTQGATGLDYAFVTGGTCSTATAYTVGQFCTVLYTFSPRAAGQRLGAVQLVNSGATTVLGTTLLSGAGTGPAVVYPATTSTPTLATLVAAIHSVAIDAAGNVYYTDSNGRAIKELVAVGGVVSAGSAIKTLGGPASLGNPYGVAVDGAGNVYVADTTGIVKEILAVAGVVSSTSTVKSVGNTTGNFQAVAVDGAGNVFVADNHGDSVKEIVAVDGVTSLSSTVNAIGSGFFSPSGVAVDAAGNVYVADTNNNAVKKIVAVGGVVSSASTVTSLGSFNFPTGVSIDAAGNVYVSELNGAVKQIVAVGGVASSSSTVKVIGSGTAQPWGVAVDSVGNVFIGDQSSVKEIPFAVPPSLAFATTFVGSTSSDSPRTVAVQNVGNATLNLASVTASSHFTPTIITGGNLTGNLSLTDNAFGGVQAIPLSGTATPTTTPQTITFTQPVTPVFTGATATLVATSTSGLAVTFSITGGTGTATLSGTNNSTITYTGAGTIQITASQPGNATYAAATPVTNTVTASVQPSTVTAPTTDVGSTSVSQNTSITFTTAGTPSTIKLLTQGATGLDYALATGGTCSTSTAYTVGQTCTVMWTFSPKAPGRRLGAISIANSSGAILSSTLISGTGNGPQGLFTTPVGTILASGLSSPRGLTVDASGNVYVAESGGTVLDKFLPGGGVTQYTVPSGSTSTAVDGAGNIFFGNGNNVYEILAATTTPVVYASGVGNADNNLQVDTAGNLFLTSSSNNNLYVVPVAAPHTPSVVFPGGTFATIPGTHLAVATGRIIGTAIDAGNNLFLVDYSGNDLYEVPAGSSSPSLLVAGGGFNNPHGLAIDPAGDLYVTNASGAPNLQRYSGPYSGGTAGHFDQYPSLNGQYGAAVGSDGTLYLINGNSINQYVRKSGPALAFGTVSVGTTSAASLQTFENDGNAPMSISSIAGSSANFGLVGAVSGNKAACGSTLVAGDICGLSATFSPTGPGPYSGTGIVTDNSFNVAGATQTLPLSGTGLAAPPTVTSISPTTGVSGTTVTVTGTNLTGITTVSFGATNATSFTLVNNTTLTAVAPAGTGVVDITVGNGTSTSPASSADQFTYKIAPASIVWNPSSTKGFAGLAIGAGVLDATDATPGSITYTATNASSVTTPITAASTLAAGVYTLTATFTPTDTTTYSTRTATLSFTIVTQYVILVGSAGSVTSASDDGSLQSSAASGGGIGAAIDSDGNVWSVNVNGSGVTRFTDTGVFSASFTATGLANATALAIDGNSTVWFAQGGASSNVYALTNAGAAVSVTGLAKAGNISTPAAISIDAAGSVWVANSGNGTVTEVIGVAAPIATPTVTQTVNATPGAKP